MAGAANRVAAAPQGESSSQALVVDAYDGSFSLSIPENWRLIPKESFKANVPVIALEPQEPVSKEAQGLMESSKGLIITELVDTSTSAAVSLKDLAKQDLERMRLSGLCKDSPSVRIAPVRIKRGLDWGYTFRVGTGSCDETVVYFSFENRHYKAACTNSQRRQCRKILASIAKITEVH